MAITLKNAAADSMLNGLQAHINSGGGSSAEIRIFTTAFGTLLATFTLNATPFDVAEAGTGSLRRIKVNGLPLNTTGAANGTAAVFRIVNEDATPATVCEGTVTATGGGGDMELDNTSIATAQTVNLTTGNLTIDAVLGA